MTTRTQSPTVVALCLAVTVGCAGHQQKVTANRESPVVEGLDGMCRRVRAVEADAGICPQDRRTVLKNDAEWKRIGASEPGREIVKTAQAAIGNGRYATLVALAEREGRPGWNCEELRRFVDEDPSFIRPKLDGQFLSDLDKYCQIMKKNWQDIPEPHRAQAIQQEVVQEAGCAMKDMLQALSGVEVASRYQLMQQMAAEAGAPHWRCTALEPNNPS